MRCAAEKAARKQKEREEAASKRQLADPDDLAADLQRGFKLEPAVRVLDEAKLNPRRDADYAAIAELIVAKTTAARKAEEAASQNAAAQVSCG